MAAALDYLLCILALIALIWETYLIARRNRTIIVKGKDDFFTLCLVMLFAVLLLRPYDNAGLLRSLRNTLILLAIFVTMAVKRGVSERGIEKLGYVIPWEKIRKIGIEPYQQAKLTLIVYTDNKRYKLIYPRYQLKKLVYELQKHYPEVMLEETLRL